MVKRHYATWRAEYIFRKSHGIKLMTLLTNSFCERVSTLVVWYRATWCIFQSNFKNLEKIHSEKVSYIPGKWNFLALILKFPQKKAFLYFGKRKPRKEKLSLYFGKRKPRKTSLHYRERKPKRKRKRFIFQESNFPSLKNKKITLNMNFLPPA